MLLGSLAGLQWYGSATGAMVDTAPSTEPQMSLKADKRLVASIQGGEIEPYIKGTMAKKQTLVVQGTGELQTANWKKKGRIALDVSIGAVPSAFDITQSVLNALAASYNISGTIGAKINSSGGGGSSSGGTIIREDELAQGGNKLRIILNSAASSINNLYEGSTIVIMSGTGAGQARKITRYTAATRTADVLPTFTVAPDSTSVYRIIP